MAYLKTFTSKPLLKEYYKEVEKVFKDQLKDLIDQYTPIGETQQEALNEELEKVNKVLKKMDFRFARALKDSLNSYAKHVHKSNRNFLEYFVLPMNFPGVTD